MTNKFVVQPKVLDLLKRLTEEPAGRYLISVALTPKEYDAQEKPAYGGKGHKRWLTEVEFNGLCSLAQQLEAPPREPEGENEGP
jgi:hypothetical protein